MNAESTVDHLGFVMVSDRAVVDDNGCQMVTVYVKANEPEARREGFLASLAPFLRFIESDFPFTHNWGSAPTRQADKLSNYNVMYVKN
ncbi:hypothetical protein Ccrd_014275 [Cynara cardunculus var. scolymus]|uniref:Uncharacterized protein n=1 Tax=Cynara cardunculus var. scolymus TaxID=59895 RepID=A0A103YE13_CYNCS|nr:hypothetical protein Ccrd_014275 [Cynara cardunculus var. scolymus]